MIGFYALESGLMKSGNINVGDVLYLDLDDDKIVSVRRDLIVFDIIVGIFTFIIFLGVTFVFSENLDDINKKEQIEREEKIRQERLIKVQPISLQAITPVTIKENIILIDEDNVSNKSLPPLYDEGIKKDSNNQFHFIV